MGAKLCKDSEAPLFICKINCVNQSENIQISRDELDSGFCDEESEKTQKEKVKEEKGK